MTTGKRVWAAFLLVVGLITAGFGIWNWFTIPDSPRTTTVTERTDATKQTVATTDGGGTSETTTETLGGAAGTQSGTTEARNSTTTKGTTATTDAMPFSKTTTTSTPEASRRSETISLALLGMGAAFVLSGAFYGRIHKIGFAGVEVELTDQSDAVKVAVAKLQKTVDAVSRTLLKMDARVKKLEEP